MVLQVDNAKYINWSLEQPTQLESGQAFYEIKIPNKYLGFDRIYAFSNINPDANAGMVYFQNATPKLQDCTPDDYIAATARNVPYNGLRQAISDPTRSTICFSDPGNFLKGQITSWYSVANGVDICFYLAEFISHWLDAASLNSSQVLMFGSSSGSFAALRTATFMKSKINVIAVNSQIKQKLNYASNTYKHNLISYYEKCLQRKAIIPNIYLLCNYRDQNTLLNRQFFNTITYYPYQKKGTYRPNIIFDLYDGLTGHKRPRKENMLEKIELAEALLKSSQEEQNFQRAKEQVIE